MTAEFFGFTGENSVGISFLPTETQGHPIGTVLYRIVSNAVPMLLRLSTHTFHNCIMRQTNPELSLRHLIPFCFSWHACLHRGAKLIRSGTSGLRRASVEVSGEVIMLLRYAQRERETACGSVDCEC